MPTTHIASGEDMDTGTTHPGDSTINGIFDRLDALEALFPHGTGFADWTPRLVVNDANASNGYTPSSGTNPALGTGTFAGNANAAGAVGRAFQVGKLVVATFEITFGASSVSAGSGAYRVTLPYPCAAHPQTYATPIGFGHLFNPSVPNTFLGLGPGNFRHFMLHSPSAAIASDVAGLVIGVNQPIPAALRTAGFTLSHHTDDTAMDETAPGASYNQTLAVETRNVLGTLINAELAAWSTNVLDNTGDTNPWAWSAGCRVLGVQVYEAA